MLKKRNNEHFWVRAKKKKLKLVLFTDVQMQFQKNKQKKPHEVIKKRAFWGRFFF